MLPICSTCSCPPSSTSIRLPPPFIPFELVSSILQYIFSFSFSYLTHFPSVSSSSLFGSVFPPPTIFSAPPSSSLLPPPPSSSRLWAILNNCSAALSFTRCLSRFGCYLHTQHARTTPKTICNRTCGHVHPSTVKENRGLSRAAGPIAHWEPLTMHQSMALQVCVGFLVHLPGCTSFSFPLIHPTVYRSLFP